LEKQIQCATEFFTELVRKYQKKRFPKSVLQEMQKVWRTSIGPPITMKDCMDGVNQLALRGEINIINETSEIEITDRFGAHTADVKSSPKPEQGTSLQMEQQNRDQFLRAVYRVYQTNGPAADCNMWEIGKELGLDQLSINKVAQWLAGHSYISFVASGGGMKITTLGIDLIEQSLSKAQQIKKEDTSGFERPRAHVTKDWQGWQMTLDIVNRLQDQLKRNKDSLPTPVANQFQRQYQEIRKDILSTDSEMSGHLQDLPPFDEGSMEREYGNKTSVLAVRLLGCLEPAIPWLERKIHETRTKPVEGASDSSRVFIVHGHDAASEIELARMLEKMGLEPIILHEQPEKGRALIEKLEDHTSNVGYAFILLTPDDIGSSKEKASNLRPRARQNVVFEFGYLMGKLGRSRICCLHTSDVEIPSDIQGIVYVPFDKSVNEAYKKILEELRAAGYDPKA
jgi:predicted nucleotide-binding protein